LQRHISEPPKTQNSKIPERHHILKPPSPKPRPKPSLSRLSPHSPTPSPQFPLSLVFTHPSTYHRKVYGRSNQRTSPGRTCLSETLHSILPSPKSLTPSPSPWPLSPSPRRRTN
jgi:hypothetical protein